MRCLFVFQKLVVGDALFEFFRSQEEIFHSVLFGSSRRTAGGRNGESQVQVLGQQVVDDGGFPGA